MLRTSRRTRRRRASDQQLDDLCREVVFRRDGYHCWDCGKGPAERVPRPKGGWKYPGFDWSHVWGRGRKSMRWIPENSLCACDSCHYLWHDGRFMIEKLEKFKARFPQRYQRLLLLSQVRHPKVDREATRLYLEQELGDGPRSRQVR